MSTRKEQITVKAIELIKVVPNGLRYSDLVRKLQESCSGVPVNTIHGTIWNLDARLPKEIYKPARGLFRHVVYKDSQEVEEKYETLVKGGPVREEDFYQPFADYLVEELEECTKAIVLGGSKFKDKWGTPDVLGIRKPRESDIIRPATEIVSAELKIDTKDLVTAFGQACSYKLFSHKSYLVIPKRSPEEEKSRIEALSLIFGIGLIWLDVATNKAPEFEIRVRPIKQEPDMFYVNKYMKLVENELFA